MLKLVTWVGLVAACAACGSEPIGPDPDATSSGNAMGGGGAGGAGEGGAPGGSYVSGSRLKARTLVAGDGARSPAGWFDSQLRTECSFIVLADGSTRCAPSFSAPLYYADDACTQKLAVAPCGGSPAPYIGDGDGCAKGPKLYPVTDAVSPVTVYIKELGCQPIVPAAMQFYAVGIESLPSNFVEAEAEVEP